MKKNLIELWGDLVDLKDLIIAIGICSVTTMGGFFLAPTQDTTKQLFFGLGGAVLGFMISTFLITPKRIVIEEEDN
ncbi:hypothetical protein BCR22_12115 [Enterococcus plantarum]|uniref:Uncharacterized protein n=1 Tax=Enterococcus plantarum TaxID=1077675 RepID=A0A2W3Z3M3_9ENTE|nr:hypothetical protein [Enterococcus plantarum]MBO0423727.1 hypothetical protein [Enterococcus plantarum]MBO0468723.1 hypothetical protein [Enterococcus plantarum]OEG17888.1 hypothetical protein BCR22_12115 [Enterococcus plantarum]PZL70897.1 hypothetical protein CI088_13495 [Enterococcus plantarum]